MQAILEDMKKDPTSGYRSGVHATRSEISTHIKNQNLRQFQFCLARSIEMDNENFVRWLINEIFTNQPSEVAKEFLYHYIVCLL